MIVDELEKQNSDLKEYFKECPGDKDALLENLPERFEDDADETAIKATESMWDYNEGDDYSVDEPFFGLWVGAFKERQEALDLVDDLQEKGMEAYSIYSLEFENLNDEPYWCVTIGKSGSEPEAQAYIKDAEKMGYKEAYVKYTGERLSHRLYYYAYGTTGIDITSSKITLNEVDTEELSGTAESEGPMTLVIDQDTVFDKTCDMQAFNGYKKGQSPLEWFNGVSGEYLMGVFEVGITGNHIDSFYGAYWWD